MSLSAKQQRFVEEYLVDFNATQAAIRAGYSPRSADSQGSRLLKNRKVSRAIQERMAELSRRTGVTAERIMQELARIAFLDPTKVTDVNTGKVLPDASPDDRAAIASVKVRRSTSESGDMVEREVRFADKIRALELLGKRFGMWTDKQDVSLNAQVTIVDDIDDGQDTGSGE